MKIYIIDTLYGLLYTKRRKDKHIPAGIVSRSALHILKHTRAYGNAEKARSAKGEK